MEELAKKKSLVITNADKSGALVTMDTDSYIKEASRQNKLQIFSSRSNNIS